MKTFLKIIVGFAFVIILAGGIIYGCEYYNHNLKLTDIAENSSDNGGYSAVIQQVGLPKGLFGDAQVRITVKDAEGNALHNFDSEIANDGKCLNYTNWNVQWSDNSVTITLLGEEQKPENFTFELN